MQRLLEQEKQTDYLLLSITTDPARDNPKALKSYVVSLRRTTGIGCCSGKEKHSQKFGRFRRNREKSADGEVQHTTLTTVIDRRGNCRVDYYGDKWQEKEVLKDMSSLKARNQPSE